MANFLETQRFQPADPLASCALCNEAYEDHRASDGACPEAEDGELPEGYLTEHFTLAEMIASDTANDCGIDNTPSPEIVDNLTILCEVLEDIRMLCDNHDVIVNSGYRCEALNAEVGGVEDSAHRYGLGADIVIPAFGTPSEICDRLKPYLAELGIDQLIDESSGDARWVHVGLSEGPPRCECFAL
jgi:zinc D-Ala-D-Ala carboxypeptidase